MTVSRCPPSPSGSVLHADPASEERAGPGGRGTAQHQGPGREQQVPRLHQY